MLSSPRSVIMRFELIMKMWYIRPFSYHNLGCSIISRKLMMTDLSETPSDGFKIGIAVWGVVRAFENPRSKNLHQFFSKRANLKSCKFHPFWILLKYMKINWIFDSQKKNTAYFSVFFFNSNQGKRNSLQCFSETLMIEFAWKSLRHSIQQNPRVDFFVDWINSENTLFFYLIKKKKKKMNEEAG